MKWGRTEDSPEVVTQTLKTSDFRLVWMWLRTGMAKQTKNRLTTFLLWGRQKTLFDCEIVVLQLFSDENEFRFPNYTIEWWLWVGEKKMSEHDVCVCLCGCPVLASWLKDAMAFPIPPRNSRLWYAHTHFCHIWRRCCLNLHWHPYISGIHTHTHTHTPSCWQ